MPESKPTKTPPSKSLVRSVAVLASGTAFSQVILVAASPILTRLYTPDQFGLLAAYIAVVTIVGAIATLRYELVIPLPRSDGMAVNALVLTIGSVLVITLICALLVAVAGPQIGDILNLRQLLPYVWLVPLGILSLGTYTALNNWAVRRRSFSTITRTKMTQSLSQTVIQIVAAFTPAATAGLLFGNLIGQSAGITSFIREFVKQSAATLHELSWKRVLFLARRYKQFPLVSLPASVAFSASQQAPSLIMMSMFGPATAGFYLLAQRVGMMPATLLGTAMSQSVYRNLAEQRKDVAGMGRAVFEPVRTMSGLLIAPAIGMAVIAPPLVSLAFGHDWEQAGHYLRWMAPWVATTIIFGAMSPIVSVLGLQISGLIFQVSSLVLSALAMYIAGTIWGPVVAIAAFSITKALTIITYRLWMLKWLEVRIAGFGASMLVHTILFGALFSAAAYIGENDLWTRPVRYLSVSGLVLLALFAYAAINLKALRQYRRRNALPTRSQDDSERAQAKPREP